MPTILASDRIRSPWWSAEQDDSHGILVQLVDWIRERDSVRMERLRLWDEVYRGTSTLGSTDYALRRGDQLVEPGRLAGLTRNAVDFLHSKVTAQVPGVRAVGSGAQWNGLRTRRMTHFIEGAMRAVDLQTEVARTALLGLKSGTAGIKCAVVDGRLHAESIPCRELFFDPDDSRHGRPRCMYQLRPVGRGELLARWSDGDDAFADAILSAPLADDSHGQVSDDRWSWDGTHDAVDVYEAWRLPNGDEPGRHVIAIKGMTLLDEDWDCPRFPIAMFIAADDDVGHGIYGQGVVERLVPIQDSIDFLMQQIDESIRQARLKVFVADTADIVDEHLEDPSIGTIVRMAAGGTPQFVTPETVSRQVFEHLWRMVDQLYAIVGMNEAASQGLKPSGLNSGRALQYFHDFQTQRHVDIAKRVSKLAVDAVERLIDAARMAYSGDEGEETLRVSYSRGSSIRQVGWDQVDMDRDEFVIELLPVSPIPTTFSGMVQQVEDMIARGLPPPAYAEQLLSNPDVWKAARIAMADADYVDSVVERLLDADGEPPLVLQAQNLELTVDICRTELLNIVRDGAPPEVVERFDDYIQAVVDEMEPPAPNVPANANAPGITGAPQGALPPGPMAQVA